MSNEAITPSATPAEPAGNGIDVDHLRRLARLALGPEEVAAAQADLQNIVNMIDQMQSVPTTGVEPLAHPLEVAARLRPDAVTETVNRDSFQAVAPAADAGFYLVPKVID